MDPVSLAVVTSAVTAFATEFSKGLISETAKDTYHKLKELLGWSTDPPIQEIPTQTARALIAAPHKMQEILNLLEGAGGQTAAGQMVIHAKNVGAINVYGTQTNTFN